MHTIQITDKWNTNMHYQVTLLGSLWWRSSVSGLSDLLAEFCLDLEELTLSVTEVFLSEAEVSLFEAELFLFIADFTFCDGEFCLPEAELSPLYRPSPAEEGPAAVLGRGMDETVAPLFVLEEWPWCFDLSLARISHTMYMSLDFHISHLRERIEPKHNHRIYKRISARVVGGAWSSSLTVSSHI